MEIKRASFQCTTLASSSTVRHKLSTLHSEILSIGGLMPSEQVVILTLPISSSWTCSELFAVKNKHWCLEWFLLIYFTNLPWINTVHKIGYEESNEAGVWVRIRDEQHENHEAPPPLGDDLSPSSDAPLTPVDPKKKLGNKENLHVLIYCL
ncbi:hypothetical protein GOBAR_DD12967 [Gossypium barbadense]|nr:hypothetical protein GOBAR_DD12967 [Gossypium barbadense]